MFFHCMKFQHIFATETALTDLTFEFSPTMRALKVSLRIRRVGEGFSTIWKWAQKISIHISSEGYGSDKPLSQCSAARFWWHVVTWSSLGLNYKFWGLQIF